MRYFIKHFFETKSHYFASSIAFWLFFSMFPIILLIGSVGEYTTQDKDTQMLLVEGFISTIIPAFSQEFIEVQILNSAQNNQIGSLLGMIGLLITTLSVFSAIRNTFNYVWGIDHEGPSYISKIYNYGIRTTLPVVFREPKSSCAWAALERGKDKPILTFNFPSSIHLKISPERQFNSSLDCI